MDDRSVSNISDFNTDLKLKGFKAYEIKTQSSIIKSYSRKGIYKICLTTGKSAVHYADRGIGIEGSNLFFGNPFIPYSWEFISGEHSGYACLFSEDFVKGQNRSVSLQESPLFKIGGTPVFTLSKEQGEFIASIFQKMIAEQSTEYAFKNELIQNYINLIIHEALKMQPSANFFKHKKASSRITTLFLELLERQFPLETSDQPLKLRAAQDFARYLSVHVNHLNRSVKEVTGKTTTIHIAERIVTEAKSLLQHTDWSVADIAYTLGFEYPSYFNNFFKKLTGTAPSSIRAQFV